MAQTSTTLEDVYSDYLSKNSSKIIDKNKFLKYARKFDPSYKYTQIQLFLNDKAKQNEDESNTNKQRSKTSPIVIKANQNIIDIANLKNSLKKSANGNNDCSNSQDQTKNLVNQAGHDFRGKLRKSISSNAVDSKITSASVVDSSDGNDNNPALNALNNLKKVERSNSASCSMANDSNKNDISNLRNILKPTETTNNKNETVNVNDDTHDFRGKLKSNSNDWSELEDKNKNLVNQAGHDFRANLKKTEKNDITTMANDSNSNENDNISNLRNTLKPTETVNNNEAVNGSINGINESIHDFRSKLKSNINSNDLSDLEAKNKNLVNQDGHDFRGNLKKVDPTTMANDSNISKNDISNLRGNLKPTETNINDKTVTASIINDGTHDFPANLKERGTIEENATVTKNDEMKNRVLNARSNLKKATIISSDDDNKNGESKQADNGAIIWEKRSNLKKMPMQPIQPKKYEANNEASNILANAISKLAKNNINHGTYKIWIECNNKNDSTQHTSMHSSKVHFQLGDTSIFSTILYINCCDYNYLTINDLKYEICDKWKNDAIIKMIVVSVPQLTCDLFMYGFLEEDVLTIEHNGKTLTDEDNDLISNYGKTFQVNIDFETIYQRMCQVNEEDTVQVEADVTLNKNFN